MKKNTENENKPTGGKWGELNLRQITATESSPRAYNKETAIFFSLSQLLKEEGNKLFQKRDYEGAIIKYERAIKVLPQNHIDVSYLRSNIAACCMEFGIDEYPNAIHECNLALEVAPDYSKALLKRARCYEALDKLDLALRDVGTILKTEENNLMAKEIQERVKRRMERQGSRGNGIPIDLVPLPEYVEPPPSFRTTVNKGKAKKTRSNLRERKVHERNNEASVSYVRNEINVVNEMEEKKTEDKLVVEEERISSIKEEEPKRTVKLVFEEDIRWAQIPLNCSVLKLREIISDRFPSSKSILVKYRDQEGDLVTITSTEELRWAEASAGHGYVKLYIVEVSPDQDPFFQKIRKDKLEMRLITENAHLGKRNESVCISDWIIEFAQFFKNYVGCDVDAYINIHEVGIKIYSEAMEETVTSDEAQELFSSAADKFQEMAALALFNWGNVHISQARKKVYSTDESSRGFVLEQVKLSYDWAQAEYTKAGEIYEEALKIKPNFYEAVLALGQQQFEQAKLSWYYAIATNVDLELWPSGEVFLLYNNAEENIEKGLQMWESTEEERLNELTKPNKIVNILQKMKMDHLFKHISDDEAQEQATNIRSQIYVLWGMMLYERSIVEYKLGLPVWSECLEVAVEKFEAAGASPNDIAVMMKNHCSNDTALEGLGFNIDEIVQAWNEMYEAKKWQNNIPSFRLEPLLRRRVSKLCYALELA